MSIYHGKYRDLAHSCTGASQDLPSLHRWQWAEVHRKRIGFLVLGMGQGDASDLFGSTWINVADWHMFGFVGMVAKPKAPLLP